MLRVSFNELPESVFALSEAAIVMSPGARIPQDLGERSVRIASQREIAGRRDPASLLFAAAARMQLEREPPEEDPQSRGVFVASRSGNQASVRRFSQSIRKGSKSPITFSISGYNILAQSAAKELNVRGPAIVQAGHGASLVGAIFLGALRLIGNHVKVAYSGISTRELGVSSDARLHGDLAAMVSVRKIDDARLGSNVDIKLDGVIRSEWEHLVSVNAARDSQLLHLLSPGPPGCHPGLHFDLVSRVQDT